MRGSRLKGMDMVSYIEVRPLHRIFRSPQPQTPKRTSILQLIKHSLRINRSVKVRIDYRLIAVIWHHIALTSTVISKNATSSSMRQLQLEDLI
jgi:hypothetical protein